MYDPLHENISLQNNYLKKLKFVWTGCQSVLHGEPQCQNKKNMSPRRKKEKNTSSNHKNFNTCQYLIHRISRDHCKKAFSEMKKLMTDNEIYHTHRLKIGITVGEFCLSHFLASRPTSVSGDYEDRWIFPETK